MRQGIDTQKAIHDRGHMDNPAMYAEFQQLLPEYRAPRSGCPKLCFIMCNSHDALYQGYWDQLMVQWYLLSCGH